MGVDTMNTKLAQTLTGLHKNQLAPLKRNPYLIVSVGREMGLTVLLDNTITIGRSPECTIQLDDPLVSREHCRIVNDGGKIFMEDNNSRNGVYVNGDKVKQCVLGIGATLQVGETIMKLESLSDIELESRKSLYNRANIDLLTGTYNRHYFEDNARRELALSKREGTPMKILMIDIDHFKQVNDKHGHLAGDYILSELAKLIAGSIREEDLLCRYGGEEFVVLLRGTIGVDDIENLCERIRRQVEERIFNYGGTRIKITISIGASCQSDTGESSLDDIIRQADAALYQSKRNGRNRTTLIETDSQASGLHGCRLDALKEYA